MNRVIALFSVLLALLLVPAAAYAQGMDEGQDDPQMEPQDTPGETERQDPPAEEDPYKWVDEYFARIKERAQIEDDELADIVKVIKAMLKKQDEAREEAKKELEEALGEERLTELQRYLRNFLEARRQGQGRGGRGGRGGPQGGIGGMMDRFVEDAKEGLGLSDEQVEEWKKKQTDFGEKVQEIFRDIQGREGFREAMGKMQEEITNLAETLKEGLDDGQKEKFDEMFQNFRNRFGGRRGGRGGRGGDRGGDGDENENQGNE